ncbi:hypothetical protein [Paraburkholderia sp.]|uniref:hypothetical protein n=1 Tax=Paraburkholderia sp. TaxID=1926495 RepID=UPI003D702039
MDVFPGVSGAAEVAPPQPADRPQQHERRAAQHGLAPREPDDETECTGAGEQRETRDRGARAVE